ncbi:flagellar brake protein [Alteromonas sp. a30]|uniref:flagellar brake protein n=1 Tax=Alteromonas sp. a30 TaxID=2730917 RepID=UPI00227EF70A|nr:flagellar brake protein [Alteromonas sp. a30]MCY7294149.1 flagellar brake protein [Alteromonas sp. a30]
MAILKEVQGLSSEDLHKMRSLRPGMPFDIQVSTTSTAKRVRTEFLGMDAMRSIMIRYPDEAKWGNLADAIYADKPMIVRFILEDATGEVIAFKTKILHVIKKPVPIIFVAFPTSIQSQGLRAEKRAQIRVPVSILNAEDEQTLASGTLVDISNSGCRISTQKTRSKRIAQKDILIRLNGQRNEPFELKGSIMNTKPDELFFNYGIKFSTSAEEVENLIERLMVEL